jgi:hypothetical protein
MKTKVLCTLANKDDVRLAPVKSKDTTVAIRGLDLVGGDVPELEKDAIYVLEFTLTKLDE